METQTYQVLENPGIYCIPGVHNTQLTLCGFVDTVYTTHDAKDHLCILFCCFTKNQKNAFLQRVF